MNTPTSSITLHGLVLNIYLGWPKSERLQKQYVKMDIKIRFIIPPRACETDYLEDTYCYDTLIKSIEKQIEAKKFRLIEHLCHEVYHIIKKTVLNQALVSIRVIKKPQIIALTEGASFLYGDFE